MKIPVVHVMVALGVAQRITKPTPSCYGGDLSHIQEFVDNILIMSLIRSN